MAMTTIPYARAEAYDNRDFVRTMADLMLARSAAAQAARMQRGANTADAWNRVGNIAMTGLAAYGQGKDEQAEIARRMQQQAILNDREERQLLAAADERKLAREERESTRRENVADRAVDRIPVGAELSMAEMRPFIGTSAEGSFEHRPAQERRLPALPIIESAGMASYPGEGQPQRFAGFPEAQTMSRDTEARPERFERMPSEQERLALLNIDRQDKALRMQIDNTRIDNQRQSDRDAQLARQYEATAAATDAYRRARLAQGNGGGAPTTAKLAVAAAAGDQSAQAALDIIRDVEGRGEQRGADKFFSLSGEFQKSPLVAAADRTIILDDAIKNVRANPGAPASQTQLAYSFVQVLDTYQSAVREGELKNIGLIDSAVGRWKNQLDGILNQQRLVSPELALEIAKTSESMVAAIKQGKAAKAADFRRRADTVGIADLWDKYYGDPNNISVDPNAQKVGGQGGGWFDSKRQRGQGGAPVAPQLGPLGTPAPQAPQAPPPGFFFGPGGY